MLGWRISLLGCQRTSGGFRVFYHRHVLGHLDTPDHFTFFLVSDDRTITIANLSILGDLVHEQLV